MIKIGLIFIGIVLSSTCYSQELIKNGGFEDWNDPSATTPDFDNPYMPKTHAGFSKTSTTLLPDWLGFNFFDYDDDRAHPILFDSRWDCDDPDSYAHFANGTTNPCGAGFTTYGNIGIPSNVFGTQPHRLPIDGFDVIGRYAGLFTSIGNNHGIKTQLLEPIECGITYNLSLWAVKKNGSGNKVHIRFSSNGQWGNPMAFNTLGHIDYDVEITQSTTWQEITGQFEFPDANGGNVWMMISTSKSGTAKGKILIDDISLTKQPCNPNNLCSSTVGCDMNVQVLDHVEMEDHSSLIINNLDKVRNLKVWIYLANGQLVRFYDIDNPPYTWEWDALSTGGVEVSDGTYGYRIEVSNDCHTVEYTGVTPKTNLKVFNVTYGTNQTSGLTFYNLDNINTVEFIVYSSPGQVLYSQTLINPEGDFSWNGLDNNGNEVASAFYSWELIAYNGCGSQTYTDTYNHYFIPDALPSQTPPSVPFRFDGCPNSYFNVMSYDRPPIPCCPFAPDIYLDNVLIGYGAEYHALNNIYIGSSVVVEDNSNVLFQAGSQIIVSPGAILADATLLEIVPCVKSAMYVEEGEYENISFIENSDRNESENISPNPNRIYPNPSSGIFNVSTSENMAGGEFFIYDLFGKIIESGRIKSRTFKIDLSNNMKGIYIIHLKSESDIFTERITLQ